MPARKVDNKPAPRLSDPELPPDLAAIPATEAPTRSAGPELELAISLPGQCPQAFLLECGVDEAGIGSAIAEVYVASCILNPARRINGLRDSKQLTSERR